MQKVDKKKHVYICVHKKLRELDAKLSLANVLAKEGFNVIIGRTGKLYKRINNLPTGLFIDVTASETRDERFYELKKKGFKIAVFDEEAIAYGDPDSYKAKRLSKKALDNIDVYFTWGQKHSDRVKEVNEKVNIISSGHPRIDLLKNKYNSIYSEQVDDIKKKYSPFVLIISHGGLLFTDSFIENEIKKDSKRFKEVGKSVDLSILKKYYEYHYRMGNFIIDITKELAREEVGMKIVYRPKPNEDKLTSISLFSDIKNVYVDNEGNIIPWLLSAEAIIHNNSAVSVEAFCCNKPIISFNPEEISSHDSILPNIVSDKCKTINDIIKKIYQVKEKKYSIQTAIKKSDISKYIKNAFDVDSMDVIKEYIATNLDIEDQKIIIKEKKIIEKIKNKIKYKVKVKISKGGIGDSKMLYIDVKKVLNKLNKSNEIKFKEIDDEIFIIYKKDESDI